MQDTNIYELFNGDHEYFQRLLQGEACNTPEDEVVDNFQFSTNFMEAFLYQKNDRVEWTQPADIHCKEAN